MLRGMTRGEKSLMVARAGVQVILGVLKVFGRLVLWVQD